MKPALAFASRQSQQGAVAVEAAICMVFILVPLLLFMIVFGKFFWYYTAAQKAIHDATLYMATAPLAEVRGRTAEVLAMHIITQETADFDGATMSQPSIDCGYRTGTSIRFRPCLSGTNTPVSVQATISLTITHPFVLPLTGTAAVNENINIFIGTEMPYVGR